MERLNEDVNSLTTVEFYLEVGFRYRQYSSSHYFQPLSEEDSSKDRPLCDFTSNIFFHLFSTKLYGVSQTSPESFLFNILIFMTLNQACLEFTNTHIPIHRLPEQNPQASFAIKEHHCKELLCLLQRIFFLWFYMLLMLILALCSQRCKLIALIRV